MDNRKATTSGLVGVVPMNMSDTVTGWCIVIFDHRGSSVLTHVSVSARKDKSLSVIRQWSSGALLTTDLVFNRPKLRLIDDDGPGLTSTPPVIRSSRMLWLCLPPPLHESKC